MKLPAGKIRVDDDPVGMFERGRIVLVADIAIERNVTGDLQAIPTGSEDPQVMVEVPDVVENEDQPGFDFVDQSPGLKGREHIAAVQIGRINGQPTIMDFSPE